MRVKTTNWKKLSIGLLAVCAIFSFLILQVQAEEKSDAIAVRVMPNPNHDSIEDWYSKQGYRGSPQSLIVDGYEAIRDGRTVFINAANIDSTNHKLYTNIYLISYNQESVGKTVDILGQLVSHWKFNSNLVTTGFCVISNLNCQADADCPKNYLCSNTAGEANQGKCIFKEENACAPGTESSCSKTKNKVCLNDSDCPVNNFCDSLKAKVTRDVKRLGEFNKIKSSLDSYKVSTGNYPGLQSGTYISGASMSVWPSWQETLWPQLNIDQLLVDPINTLGYCASGFDPKTCWNKDTNSYVNNSLILPYGSYAFIYTAAKNGANYDLCGIFEAKAAGYDTAEGQLTSQSCAVGSGYGGNNSNTAPRLISSYTSGEAGKEFNGYVKAVDAEGDLISWSLAPSICGGWPGWSAIPALKDTGDISQKKLYALKAGNSGNCAMTLTLTDSRGAATTSPLTISISAAGKPRIEAENADYFVDPVNRFNYTFYIQGSNSIPTYSFLPVLPGSNVLINSSIASAIKTVTPIGLNRFKVDLSIRIPTTTPVPNNLTIAYRITATANGSSATKDVDLNLKTEPPYLDFQCENMGRLGKAYQINENNIARSCLLGPVRSGNHSIAYSVISSSSLAIRSTTESAYLESNYLTPAGNSLVRIRATNEYGVISEKSFNIKINTFCGDGIKQKDLGANTEERGGLNNDGLEECDGSQGVQTNSISTSSAIQYGCTTEVGTNSPYPIMDNNRCVFKAADQGGGYCGDKVCQFQIVVNGQTRAMENCWNCAKDCGTCIATIVSKADNEHITYANANRLYKSQSATTLSTATTTLVLGENVFSFWTHNLADNNYGLAFKINLGPKSTSTTPVSFKEFNSGSSYVTCTSSKAFVGSYPSPTDYEPANSEKNGAYNWTEIGYNKPWLVTRTVPYSPQFPGGTLVPYIWDQSTVVAGSSDLCRLSFIYNDVNATMCQSNCAGKTCGADGCGGYCGTCNSTQMCSASGACVCRPSCNGKVCGADGCGGACGTCGAGDVCTDGACCPIQADIQVCADNEHITYFNGALIGSGADWHNVEHFSVAVQPGKNVIAIKGIDYGSYYGFSATLNQGICKSMTTNDLSNWKCSNILYSNWNTINYNDSSWPSAVITGAVGIRPGNYLPYLQIWAANAYGGSTVYCRYTFSGDGVGNQTCTPSCNGKCGGPDGCGGTCANTCGTNSPCLSPDYQTCQGSCVPFCNPAHCNQSNGCGGTCNCGSGLTCQAGWCVTGNAGAL